MGNAYETFHRAFAAACATDYPETNARFPFAERVTPTLVSPYVLDLPKDVRDQAHQIVKAFFDLRQTADWQRHAETQAPPLRDPGNTSVLMSYDFHIDASGSLRLIEVNTNASLSLITEELHRFHKVPNEFSPDFLTEILDSFAQEFRDSRWSTAHQSGTAGGSIAAHSPSSPGRNIAIVDVDPPKQRLFIEFAMYQELFKRRGWNTSFHDPSELSCENHQLMAGPKKIDLVYNRDTDFYLTSSESAPLRHAMTGDCAVITPHPFEYRLLADKDRLLELSAPGALDALSISPADRSAIERSLIRTIEVKTMEPDKLWADRKRWFFKPRRSHGGKAVYRGSSTSRGTFASILAGDYLAQEMVPPPVVKFDGEEEELKYDLRFYAYRDRIQLSCGRLYRGQMTNAQSLGGGVCPIRWI